MAGVATSNGSLRFGAFKVDLHSGELWSHGSKIHLQPQPFQILSILLEHPGELVTREEIRQKLWSSDTFVDFEHSLNTSIKKLREALGEEAGTPRYVETLPRRGYRFIGHVEPVEKITDTEVGAGLVPAQLPTDAAALLGHPQEPALIPQAQEKGVPLQPATANAQSPTDAASAAGGHPRGEWSRAERRSVPDVAMLASGGHPRFDFARRPERAEGQGVPLRPAATAQQPKPWWLSRVRVAALVLATAVVAALLALWLSGPDAAPTVTRIAQLTDDGLAKGDIMVTDGVRIYFSEEIDGHLRPVVVSAAGGEPHAIAMPFQDANVLDVSPDGSELLVGGPRTTNHPEPLWSLPVLGGSPRRISDIMASEAVWSPDGKEILYLKGWKNSHDLFLAKSDGTESRKLATAPGAPYLIRWSPDGRRISFSADDGKSNALWEVSADGGNLHPLLPSQNLVNAACSGRWTPDERYLVFDSYREPGSLWAMRVKRGWLERVTHAPTRLTAGPVVLQSPLPSKHGKRIFVLGTLPRGELLRYDPKSRQFTPYLPGTSATHLDFSDDGEWMAYVAYPEGTLWKSRVDRSQRSLLTFPPIHAFLPRWSPDGRRIVFEDLASDPPRILLISAEGGNPEPLALGPRRVDDPGWSRDGKSLVFGYPASPTQPASIHLYDLETHQISKVAGSDGIFSPRWSPDGRYIAGITWDDQNLMLFDSRTQKWTTAASGSIGWPSWSRDSKYIYFDNGTGDWKVYRVRIADRKVEQVVSLKGIEAPGDLESYVGLEPDDSVLVLKNIVSREIYALDVELP